MTKPAPIQRADRDEDIGPVDADGQQIWSSEEEAAIDRMRSDPDYLARREQALADIREGRTMSHEAFVALRAEQRRRWHADRQS